MKLQYIATLAAASLLSTSLVGLVPSNANASSLRGSTIIVADGHEGPCAGKENPCAGPCAGEENPCAGKEVPCAGS
ncbi:MAG: hypothetical protein AB4372_06940 [Xenococcus sp. (in: cyanobacteria)]